MRRSAICPICVIAALLSTVPAYSQDASRGNASGGASPDSGMRNMQDHGSSNSPMIGTPGENGWPTPVNDRQRHSFFLFDNFENEAGNSPNAFRYDFLGWYGGDVNRLWLKSEGRQNVARGEGGVEVQALYGRLISPFYDLQVGIRVDDLHGGKPSGSRAFGVLALQGFSQYRFDVEPALFVDQKGNVSARFTGTYEILITQRLVMQPRLEINFAAQDVPRFGIGRGLSDLETGARVRYEFRREFAPYVGFSFSHSYQGTADYARRAGENIHSLSFVAGVRFWWQSFRRPG